MSDRQISLEERYVEVEHLIDDAEGEIEHFEQEIQAIDENIEKIKATFKKWDMEEETDVSVAKLNISKEVYQYIIDGWNYELNELKDERYRMEGIL